jgi:hypothetical protein
MLSTHLRINPDQQTMKKAAIGALMVLFSSGIFAQTGDPARDTAWKKGGNLELLFNQAAYNNWQAGGANSFAANGRVFLFANYDYGNWSWDNALNLSYGVNLQDGVYNKTDDRIEFESRADRHLNKHWSASALLNFRTQFVDGFNNPGETADSLKISSFMAPGYVLLGLGFTYKPNDRFSAFLSPIMSKQTFVLDQMLADRGAFGVDTGSQFRQEIGGYVNFRYNQTLVENVELKAGLDLFSNYLNGNYKFIDVNGSLELVMKVNNWLTASVLMNVIYDHDIIFDTSDGGPSRRTQFKQVLGVGLTHRFGAKLPE